jgi:hypothetical protein
MSEQEQPRKLNLRTDVATPALGGEIAADVRALIEAARLRVAQTVNADSCCSIGRSGTASGETSSVKDSPVRRRLSLRCRDN